jgi:hypothetical protein
MIPLDDHDDVTAWMEEFGRTPLEAPPLIDPSLLWWKAQLMRRWDAERRAMRAIEVGEQIQVGIGVASALVLLAWLWRVLPISGGQTLFTLAILVCSALLFGAAFLLSVERDSTRPN